MIGTAMEFRVRAFAKGAFCLVAMMLAAMSSAVLAEDVHVTGRAEVVDGDTLRIGPIRIRLNGIDAPETGQTCGRAEGGDWDCATAAASRLAKLIGDRPVDCVALDQDAYGRVIATCRAGGSDVGQMLVAEGLAWAFLRYSPVYALEENTARVDRIGIWQGRAEAPWDYRENRWRRAAAASPRPGCAIKGNISVSSGARIYHTPWSSAYSRTDIDEAKSERWFCDEAEAIAAGWRPARSR